MNNKKSKKVTTYRQGDVLIIPVDTIPEGLMRTKRVTLALGEVTGHHHSIASGAIGYGTSDDALCTYFECEVEVEVKHQEHDPVKLKPGKYRSIRQVEYTAQELKQVRD
jgi:hypothetical protein